MCMGSLNPLFSYAPQLSGASPLSLFTLLLASPSSSAITVRGSSIHWIAVWGAFIHIWRPEIADGYDLSCLLKWQEVKWSESRSAESDCLQSMDYTVHGILQVKIMERVSVPFSRGSSQPRDRTQVSWVAGDSLQAEPQGKPKNTGVGSLSLLQGIFPTRELNCVSCIAGGFFTNWAIREYGRRHFYFTCVNRQRKPRFWPARNIFVLPTTNIRLSRVALDFWLNWEDSVAIHWEQESGRGLGQKA